MFHMFALKPSMSGVIFPQVTLGALLVQRAEVPRDWSSEHEVAWTWLWENVVRLPGTIRETRGRGGCVCGEMGNDRGKAATL